jgi:hypothetical protein
MSAAAAPWIEILLPPQRAAEELWPSTHNIGVNLALPIEHCASLKKGLRNEHVGTCCTINLTNFAETSYLSRTNSDQSHREPVTRGLYVAGRDAYYYFMQTMVLLCMTATDY